MIKDNTQLVDFLLTQAESPGEFLDKYLKMNDMTQTDLSRILGTSSEYINQICTNRYIPGKKACLSLAIALNIDPYVFNRLASDYALKQYIKQMKFKDFVKEMTNSSEAKDLMKGVYAIAKKVWEAGYNSK